MNKKILIAFVAILIQLLIFSLVSIALDKPIGSVTGMVSLEKGGFYLQFADFTDHKAYVTATGPRGKSPEERGVWVKPDGSFRIDHLAKGEYSLKIHANGYNTCYLSGIFIDDGRVTPLKHLASLSILEPSVSIASNRKVFTSKENPYFWINCYGANKATIKLYKTDIVSLMRDNFIEKNKNRHDDGDNTDEASDQDESDTNSSPHLYSGINFGNNFSLYKNYGSEEPKFLVGQKPVKVLNRKIDSAQEEWANLQFKLSEPLDYGDYIGLAEVSNHAGKKEWDIFWFNVSDLGLVVKMDTDLLVAQAIDLNTLKPLANTNLDIEYKDGKHYVNELTTDQDGIVTARLSGLPKTTKSHDLFVVGTHDQSCTYGGLWFYGNDRQSDNYKSYFYTERPIYRLGQTVYFKNITRTLEGDGFHTPKAGLVVNTIIEDPTNNKVWQGKFKTNQYGSFNGIYDIPEEASTGAYQLTFTFPDGSKQFGGFEVAQYRKPEYEVTVQPTQTRIIAGNNLKAKIKATYYFGAPVVNAKVKYSVYASNDGQTRYRLMPRPSYYSYFDDWSDDDADSPSYITYSGGGEYITEGVAQTDANGEAIIEVQTKKLTLPTTPYDNDYCDKVYKVEAEVTDLSRMSVIGSGNCLVSTGNFALFVQPNTYVVKAGQPMPITVNAINYDNKPVANQNVTVKLGRWVWDQGKYTGLQIEGEKSVITDIQGKATITFPTKDSFPSDNYIAMVKGNDSAGNTIYNQSSIWIASERYPYFVSGEDAKKEALQIKLDKFAYEPGGKATAIITTPLTGKEGVRALIAIEGKKIHKWWTIPIAATATSIEIPIDACYEPNVYMTVSIVGLNHQFYQQSKTIRVSPKEHFLNISISPDKEKYIPGETAKYTIKATSKNGDPLSNVELSFGLVDESIYAIRSEAAENIEKFFYNKRYNEVITSCTFAEEYSGGPDKIGSSPTVRKDFRDTAIWLPDLKTDKTGIAIASVTLPDNLTTWRATVRGITQGTDVGWTINKVIATQDLIVRLALPRFFSLGDETYINAVVHNYTNKTQPIKLLLTTSPEFAVKEKAEQHLTLEPDKVQSFSWPVKLIRSGSGTVTIKAIGKTAADAMESKVNVLALGVPEFAINCGELLDNPSSINIAAPVISKTSPGTYKHQLGISGSSIGPVLGNFDKLIDYPYGCTEQTMSRLMPSVVAMKLHRELGLAIDGKLRDRFAKVYKRSIAKLNDYQHPDGGWGWWKNDQSNIYLTSLVLEGFYQLKEVGYKIDNAQLKQSTEWLRQNSEALYNQLTNAKIIYYSEIDKDWQEREFATDLAKASYTLALYKVKTPTKVTQWLVSRISKLPPEALCYLTIALKHSNDSRFEQSYKQLLALANHTNNYVEWDHTTALMKRMGLIKVLFGDYTYRYTGIETTALALRTVLIAEPNNDQLIESIKRWLLIERDSNGWANTKTTAQVFLALLEEQLLFNHNNATNETVKISAAGKLFKQLNYDATDCYGAEDQILLPQSNKGEKVSLDKAGPGRIYYNSLITYMRTLSPDENIAAKSSPQGLSIERSFYRLKPSAVTSDGKIHFNSEQITDKTIKAGETVLMKIKVNSPIRLPYMILEAYLPSGAEVVHDDSKEDLVEKDTDNDSNIVGDWSPVWWSHQDILDDRIVFFSTDLPQGKSEFSSLVRMEMPGNYQINPLRLEGMYAKKVRAVLKS